MRENLLFGRSFIESQQLVDAEALEEFYRLAHKYKKVGRGDCLKGKRIATIFYEPSTRTRLSFEAAIDNLGGTWLSTENAREFSSAVKGECLEHSIRVVSSYADAFILRHYEDDAAQRARDVLDGFGIIKPVINAGCGRSQHPTQAGVDWFTAREKLGRTDDLNIVIAGDLMSRTSRSFGYLMGRGKNITMGLVSPVELAMGLDLLGYYNRHGVRYTEHRTLEEVIEAADIVYVNRIQKERFANPEQYERVKHSVHVTVQLAERMKPGAILMHPLPIVDEIDRAVDRMPCSVYFEQSDNGVPVRMALLDLIMCCKHF